MHQAQNETATSTQWQFEQLYQPAFLRQVILPLLIAFPAYYLYLYLDLRGADTFVKPLSGAIAYLLLAFWLLRANYSSWQARIPDAPTAAERSFPFPSLRDYPYNYLLLANGILALLALFFRPAVLPELHLLLLLATFLLRMAGIIINDFYRSIRAHFSYFYPSILSIVILAFVIAQQEQFGDFFLELAYSPLNFIAFSLIFGVSIITVWFAPSYLFFTDHFQLGVAQEKAISAKFGIWEKGFLVLLSIVTWLSRLLPGAMHALFRYLARNSTESDLMALLWKHKNEINTPVNYQPEPRGFTLTRILLGLLYIATLATLAGNVWLKSFGMDWQQMSTAILLLSLLTPLTITYLYFYAFEHQKTGNLQSFRNSLQYSWTLITIIFLGFTITLVTLITLNYFAYQEKRLFLALLVFILTTIFTSIPLITYSYTFQKLYNYLKALQIPQIEQLKKFARFFIAIVLGANASVAGLSLLVLLIMLFVPFEAVYSCISEINTINIYILLVNGLIAGITLLDRFVRIRSKVNQIYWPHSKRLSAAARTWAIILMVVLPGLFLLRSNGNNYHKVPYVSSTTIPPSLTAYTQNYLDNLLAQTDTTAPIILIAADGGGLKAAAWTMLNLYHLDSLGHYNDQVFLMAGASGGSLGQGLYTYMKAQGLSPAQIKSVIKRLIDMNFVSGDLAGVMTRWPYGMIPDIANWPERTQDRMEAMTETYFNTIQEVVDQPTNDTNNWSYEQLRQKPYASLWADRDQAAVPHLPAFIANSARAEDGVKAWSHPFAVDPYLSAGAVDLSTYVDATDTTYISYPDALFLTNRFPILSPAAKIRGKGHFIDAGAVDNSGLETLLQFLTKMQAMARQGDRSCQAFFAQAAVRKIKIISIRHSRGRFIDELFTQRVEGALENTNRKSELSAFFGAVVSAGIYGKPKVVDELVTTGEARQLLHIDTLLTVNLPFRLNYPAVENHFFRKIDPQTAAAIQLDITAVNRQIEQTNGNARLVEPALGRLLSQPSQRYLQRMLHYPDVTGKYEAL